MSIRHEPKISRKETKECFEMLRAENFEEQEGEGRKRRSKLFEKGCLMMKLVAYHKKAIRC
jgi:hypothetical protein